MNDFNRKEICSERAEPAPGVLYIVGTPIGNRGDLSIRAESILKNVSAIACEDTRHSGKLLKSLGSTAPLFSFYKHNTQRRIPQLLSLLKEGKSLALISDAGLPGISDPGEQLVACARHAGLDVICIPGPCAATTALVSSGLPCNRFCFEGFLPTKKTDRKVLLDKIAKETRTTVIYESPRRLVLLLEELAQVCGEERPLQVARELTKRYEQQVGSTIKEALQYFINNHPKGECTIVLGGATCKSKVVSNEKDLLLEMQKLIENGASANEAARELARSSGNSKRFLYSLLHKPGKDRN